MSTGRSPFAAPLHLLALALLAGCGGGPSGPIDGGRAYAHLEKLVGIGPRPFGSENLAAAADYIAAELRALGLEPKRQEVLHEKEKKTIRNLWVEIDGTEPGDGPILILGAHYDTKLAAGHSEASHNFPFVGAIDGGGAPAVLLELARHLKEPANRPPVDVWLYWIDAEESIDWNWNDERALLGSKAFCEMLHEKKILPRVKAFVLLDLIGSKNFKIDKDGNSDPRLLDISMAAAQELGIADDLAMWKYPTAAEVAAYKNQGRAWGTKDDHEVFRNFGVPSLLLIDFSRRIPGQEPAEPYEQWWHTPDDDLDQVDPDALAHAGNLVVAMLPALADFCQGGKSGSNRKK